MALLTFQYTALDAAGAKRSGSVDAETREAAVARLAADGRYVLNPGSDEGIYVFSSGDGTLRLQSNSFFSKGVMIWSCQVSGDSLSCVDPEGAGHVYSRLK